MALRSSAVWSKVIARGHELSCQPGVARMCSFEDVQAS